jgi:hypothetical protein
MIRNLGVDDIEQAYTVAISKPIRNETEYISKTIITDTILDPKNVSLGYFEDDELISWSLVRFGLLHEKKVWAILFFFTKRFSNHFSFKTNDFGPMMDRYFQIAEEREYYSYIYSVPLKSQNAYYRKWKSVEGRYITTDLAMVPAGTLPTEGWIARLNGGIKSYDTVIKKRTLKHEFRKDNSIASVESAEA